MIKGSYFFMYKLILTIIFILMFPVISHSQEASKSIDIDSDNFTLDIKNSTMIFYGNVKIKMTNFSAVCNRAEVFIEQKSKKLEKLKMTGKAKIQKDNSEINADTVIFEPSSDKLYVEGNVKTKIKINN